VEFSQNGFAGARVDEIARRAKVNKATLYYHIGDKEQLYSAVLHRVFKSVADQMAERIKAAKGPLQKLEQYVRTIAENLERNPLLPPIMLREMASQGKSWPDIVVMDFARIFELLSGILTLGRETGIFREVSTLAIHLSALGPLLFLNTMESKIRAHTKDGKMLPDAVSFPENIADTVVANVLNSVLKKG
jgi:AcrR family transcriptional regulator